MPVVLGIDQSLRHTGLFWLTQDGVPDWRQIDTEDLRGAERLVFIKNSILAVVNTVKPDLAAMEGYSYGSAGKVFELGELGGVIKVLLQEQCVPLVVASPVQVKKFITGNHQAEKTAVVDAVNTEYQLGWSLRDNNLADAAALASIARAYLSTEPQVLRHRAEVIAALGKKLTLKQSKPRRKPRLKFHAI